MKKYLGKLLFLVMVVFITFLFISCPNQLNSPILESDLSESSAEGYVYNDPSRGMSVYVDDFGVETLIQSDEEFGNVVCSEFIDFIPLNSSDSGARSMEQGSDYAKAIILGKRSDGYPGIWMVYSSGRVTPIVNSDSIDTSELLNIVEFRQPLSKYFGWTYEALEMIPSEDDSEIIITGYAVNVAGINSWFYTLDPGTTIGVYWAVTKDDEGFYHISRAKVIGLKDRSWWKDFRQNIDKSDYRNRYRWMWALRMFFSGWFDKYLVMPDSIELGDNEGEYNIYGSDQDGVEGETSVAVVTAKRVLSVEKYDDPGTGDKLSLYAVKGPAEVWMDAGSGSLQTVTLITDAPDGDIKAFASDPLLSYATLNTTEGVITVINADWNNGSSYDLLINVWIVDKYDLLSAKFELTIHFGS